MTAAMGRGRREEGHQSLAEGQMRDTQQQQQQQQRG